MTSDSTPSGPPRRRRRRATSSQGAPPRPAGTEPSRPADTEPPAAPEPPTAAAPEKPRKPRKPRASKQPSPQPVAPSPRENTEAPRRRRPTRDNGERGLRDLAGSGPSQVGVSGALRARDVNRPTEADLAEAEQQVTIVRRSWDPAQPPAARSKRS